MIFLAGRNEKRCRFQLSQLMIVITALAMLFAIFSYVHRSVLLRLNNQGLNGWMRLSPFTDVQITKNGSVQVEFEGDSFELVSINDVQTKGILKSSQRQFGRLWKKRFVEDLPEVLMGMGVRELNTVKLGLRDQTGNVVTVDEAPMTRDNRQMVYRSHNARISQNN